MKSVTELTFGKSFQGFVCTGLACILRQATYLCGARLVDRRIRLRIARELRLVRPVADFSQLLFETRDFPVEISRFTRNHVCFG